MIKVEVWEGGQLSIRHQHLPLTGGDAAAMA